MTPMSLKLGQTEVQSDLPTDDDTRSLRRRHSSNKSASAHQESHSSTTMVPKALLNEGGTNCEKSHKTDSNGMSNLPLFEKNNYASTAFSKELQHINDYDGSECPSTQSSDVTLGNDEMYLQLQPLGNNKSSQTLIHKHSPKNRSNANDSDSTSVSFDEDEFNVMDDKTALIPHSPNLKKSKLSSQRLPDFVEDVSVSTGDKIHNETAKAIGLQTLFPFLMAGLGMVAAGIILDKVQHWDVFRNVPEIFILVPALLGLKGNLEMTLASRLSTYANRGYLDDPVKRWKIIWGNMVLVEAQAMVVAFLASLVAMVLGWIPDGKWETNHAIILCTGSLLTGAIASCLLGLVMILVVLMSRKLGINPDNVATPIAASLGDLITLSLLSSIVLGLYSVLYYPPTAWIGPAIIALFAVLTPLFLWLSHRNEFTRDVVKHGWVPVISAMGISSTGGFILDFAVSQNPGVAVFSPVINGVGGNLVAVQASRISTYLHTSGFPLGHLPPNDKAGCISPWQTFISSSNLHAVGARVMLIMVVPGQLLFVLIIQALQAGHTSITPQFVAVYILVSLIQVSILLQVCNWMVLRLWNSGDDPDNCAIPYLTALGDLLGTGLLAAGFLFLWLVGDRDMDVGD